MERAADLKLTKLASARLDLIRAVAAFVVLIGHGRVLFLVDFAGLQRPGIAAKILYAVTGLGHQAVMVFFVLSGLLITRSVRKAVVTDQWSWGNYALSRLTRLYLVLIPAIALGAMWDFGGSRLFGDLGVYGGRNYAMLMKAPVESHLGPMTALINLVFTQGILGPTYGSNGPLWSLSYEFWYYALFPLIYLSTHPRVALGTRVVGLTLAALVAFFVKGQILSLFPVWLMGAALAILPPVSERIGRRLRWIGGGAFLAFLGFTRMRPVMPTLVEDTVLGFLFALVAAGILAQRDKAEAPAYLPVAKTLSGMSYSLYLMHLPLLVFLNAWLIGQQPRWQPGVASLLILGALLFAAIVYAYLIALVTENRTDQARAWLARFFSRRGKRVGIVQ